MKQAMTLRGMAKQVGRSPERIKQLLAKYRRMMQRRALAYTPPMETDPDLVEQAWRKLEASNHNKGA